MRNGASFLRWGMAIRPRVRYELPSNSLSQADDLRYGSEQILSTLGGVSDDRLIPRRFLTTPDGTAQQLTLFEDAPDYWVDDL